MKTNDYAVQVDGRAWRIAREGARRRKAIGWSDALSSLSKNASLTERRSTAGALSSTAALEPPRTADFSSAKRIFDRLLGLSSRRRKPRPARAEKSNRPSPSSGRTKPMPKTAHEPEPKAIPPPDHPGEGIFILQKTGLFCFALTAQKRKPEARSEGAGSARFPAGRSKRNPRPAFIRAKIEP